MGPAQVEGSVAVLRVVEGSHRTRRQRWASAPGFSRAIFVCASPHQRHSHARLCSCDGHLGGIAHLIFTSCRSRGIRRLCVRRLGTTLFGNMCVPTAVECPLQTSRADVAWLRRSARVAQALHKPASQLNFRGLGHDKYVCCAWRALLTAPPRLRTDSIMPLPRTFRRRQAKEDPAPQAGRGDVPVPDDRPLPMGTDDSSLGRPKHRVTKPKPNTPFHARCRCCDPCDPYFTSAHPRGSGNPAKDGKAAKWRGLRRAAAVRRRMTPRVAKVHAFSHAHTGTLVFTPRPAQPVITVTVRHCGPRTTSPSTAVQVSDPSGAVPATATSNMPWGVSTGLGSTTAVPLTAAPGVVRFRFGHLGQ
jgi:hypothetical protein